MAKELGEARQETWVNQNTGEIIETLEIRKVVGRSGFAITYAEEVLKMIDVLGNRKMAVVRYIMENMDSNNILIATIEEIAKELKMSKTTVTQALKILEKSEIVSRKTGVIMLSPRLIHKGREDRERALLVRFYEMR